jgi:transposase
MRKGHQAFVTVVSDMDQGKLIEVIDSHQQKDIIEILKQQPFQLRENVMEVNVDLWGGFPKVVQDVFPNAQIVLDRFQVMKPVNQELNKIRKQSGMTLKGSKFLLLKNHDDLTEDQQLRLTEILKYSKRLKLAYELKEEFRDIFETCITVEEGKTQFLKWITKARAVYCDVLPTISNHLDDICLLD